MVVIRTRGCGGGEARGNVTTDIIFVASTCLKLSSGSCHAPTSVVTVYAFEHYYGSIIRSQSISTDRTRGQCISPCAVHTPIFCGITRNSYMCPVTLHHKQISELNQVKLSVMRSIDTLRHAAKQQITLLKSFNHLLKL